MAQDGGQLVFFGRKQLMTLKAKAMRLGLWFRTLPRIDRVLIDLTIKVTDSVRSPSLARSIQAIATRLEGFLESKLARAVREFGFPAVQKLSLFAQKWGNRTAKEWADDQEFARYWAVMKFNGPR